MENKIISTKLVKKVPIEGDIIALHGNEKNHFRLAIALGLYFSIITKIILTIISYTIS